MAHIVKQIGRGPATKVDAYNGPSGELIMDTTNNELVLQTGVAGGQRMANKTAMVGATASAAGVTGLIPAPAAGDDTKFLRGDGTWQPLSGGGSKYFPLLSVSDDSITVSAGGTETITFTTDSDGAVSVQTSDASVATATVSGNTVTITGVSGGTAIITVSVAESNTYYGINTDVVVTSTATLENMSWSDIQTIGAAGTGANYFDIGDTKSVTLSGTVGTLAVSGTYYVFIIEFNYRNDNGIYFQGFKTADGIDIALCDASYGSFKYDGTKIFNLNHWGTSSTPYNTNYGGWKGCDFRYDILGSVSQRPSGYGSTPTTSRSGYDATSAAKTSPVANTLMAALQVELRNVLAAWTIYTDNKGNSSNTQANVTSSIDYLALLAEFEVFGTRSIANQYEQNQQAQMSYYANGNSRIKYMHSETTTACIWWLRSPSNSNAYTFCIVYTNNKANNSNSNNSIGLAPAFRVA